MLKSLKMESNSRKTDTEACRRARHGVQALRSEVETRNRTSPGESKTGGRKSKRSLGKLKCTCGKHRRVKESQYIHTHNKCQHDQEQCKS